MAVTRIGNTTIRLSQLGKVNYIFADETNQIFVSGQNFIVTPTELTLPKSWVIPKNKKLAGWANGDYVYPLGKAIPTSQIRMNNPIIAVYINCFEIELFNPDTGELKALKCAAGMLISDFLKASNFKTPDGKKFIGVIGSDGIVDTKKYISKDERFTFVWENN